MFRYKIKILAPRKGKIEVEEYDKRFIKLEKHEQKLKKHKEDLMKIIKKEVHKDTNQDEENKIDYLKEFDIYNVDTNKIFSSPLNVDNEKKMYLLKKI